MPLTTKPFVLRSVLFQIDTTEYQCEVSNVTFTPTTSTQEYAVLCPNGSGTDMGATTWVMTVEGYGIYEKTSLLDFMFTNQGSTATVTYQPKGATPGVDNPTITATVTVPPPGLGGTVNEFSTFSVEFPVQGAPTMTWTP